MILKSRYFHLNDVSFKHYCKIMSSPVCYEWVSPWTWTFVRTFFWIVQLFQKPLLLLKSTWCLGFCCLITCVSVSGHFGKYIHAHHRISDSISGCGWRFVLYSGKVQKLVEIHNFFRTKIANLNYEGFFADEQTKFPLTSGFFLQLKKAWIPKRKNTRKIKHLLLACLRVSLVIDLGCPQNFGTGWMGVFGIFMRDRAILDCSHWWEFVHT